MGPPHRHPGNGQPTPGRRMQATQIKASSGGTIRAHNRIHGGLGERDRACRANATPQSGIYGDGDRSHRTGHRRLHGHLLGSQQSAPRAASLPRAGAPGSVDDDVAARQSERRLDSQVPHLARRDQSLRISGRRRYRRPKRQPDDGRPRGAFANRARVGGLFPSFRRAGGSGAHFRRP